MTMTVATLILPMHDNEGVETTNTRAFCERKILKAFNGFTATKAYGAWINDEGKPICEHVTKYEIAADWDGADRENRTILCQIAKAFAIDAAQDCVYVAFPDGVRFISQFWTEWD